MKKILVTGVTGALGNATIEALISKTDAKNVVVLARDEQKIEMLKAKGLEVRIGNYDDYASLITAFKEIDKVFFISGNDIVNRVKQHQNVVQAAKEAGVKHVVYTSFERVNETSTSPIATVAEAHIKTENGLKESGMTYTILKNNIYLDILPMFLGEDFLNTQKLFLPAGEGKVSFVSRNDIAVLAAVVLTSQGHENKIYDVTNTSAVSFVDVAKELSDILGKTITYTSITQEEYVQALTSVGVPVPYISMLSEFTEAFRQGEFTCSNNLIEELTGRKPVSLRQYLQQVYAK